MDRIRNTGFDTLNRSKLACTCKLTPLKVNRACFSHTTTHERSCWGLHSSTLDVFLPVICRFIGKFSHWFYFDGQNYNFTNDRNGSCTCIGAHAAVFVGQPGMFLLVVYHLMGKCGRWFLFQGQTSNLTTDRLVSYSKIRSRTHDQTRRIIFFSHCIICIIFIHGQTHAPSYLIEKVGSQV